MSTVTLEDLQKYVDKEALVHIKDGDRGTREVTGTIKAATVAGVPFKEKGKSGLELLTVDDIYEIDFAPTKPKSVTQKKLNPIEFGQARQHLIDRHGVELSWAKDADEKSAFEYHNGLDHSNLGHTHYTAEEVAERAKKKDEREAALESDSDES